MHMMRVSMFAILFSPLLFDQKQATGASLAQNRFKVVKSHPSMKVPITKNTPFGVEGNRETWCALQATAAVS